MEYQEILFEEKEGYAILTFNKPDKLNALSERMKQELEDAIRVVDESSTIRGLIITGAGRGFMAGTDLSEINPDRSAEETKEMSLHGQTLMNKLEELGKPAARNWLWPATCVLLVRKLFSGFPKRTWALLPATAARSGWPVCAALVLQRTCSLPPAKSVPMKRCASVLQTVWSPRSP